jgi:hypothetical protein
VATSHAAAVVQDTVVDHASEDRTDLGAEGATAQASENHADHGAHASANRARGHTDGEARSPAAKRTCDAAGRAGQTAQGAAGSLGDVSLFNAVRAAFGTLKVRQGERSFVNRWLETN